MSARYEHIGRGDAFDDVSSDAPDREISLGTTTVLAIFVALALLCGVFFGFGYSMGRKSMLPTLGNVDTHVSAPASDLGSASDTATNSSEPAPPTIVTKQSAGRSAADSVPDSESNSSARAGSLTKPSAAATSVKDTPRESPPRAAKLADDDSPSPAQHSTVSLKGAPVTGKTPASAPPEPSTATVAGVAAGQSYVQVAAISHKEDADLLLASLHRRGYSASIRQLPQDNLLHIQIGPIATKKDAEAMRQRLLSDGYNAIVK